MGMMSDMEHEDYGPKRRAAEKAIGQTRNFLAEQAQDPTNYLPAVGKLGKLAFGAAMALKGTDANAMFFGGKYLPKAVIEKAETLLKQGVSRQELFEKTGYFKNPQGEWRVYVPDKGATPTPSMNVTRGTAYNKDVLVHPDLYKLDPRLGSFVTDIKPSDELGGALGEYDPNTKSIAISGNRNVREKFSTHLHELQHLIQDIGQVNGGANPAGLTREWNTEKVVQAENSLQKLEAAFAQKYGRDFQSARHSVATNRWGEVTTDMVQDVMTIQNLKMSLVSFKNKAKKLAPFNKYTNNPGEVEARVTQAARGRDLKAEPDGLTELYDLYGKEIKAPTYYDNFQFTFD